MMRGEKTNPYPAMKRTVVKDWAWAYPTYELEISNGKKVKTMKIDASDRMADIEPANNTYGIE